VRTATSGRDGLGVHPSVVLVALVGGVEAGTQNGHRRLPPVRSLDQPVSSPGDAGLAEGRGEDRRRPPPASGRTDLLLAAVISFTPDPTVRERWNTVFTAPPQPRSP
jgi:hypothetical protein